MVRMWMVLTFSASFVAGSTAHTKDPQTVVFVCEHGAAKSVVAASHFNKLAKERGLPFCAISRGTNPDPSIPRPVSEGLRADGARLDRAFVPSLVATADTAKAVRVVTFDVKLPAGVQASSVRNWSAVPALSDARLVISARQ